MKAVLLPNRIRVKPVPTTKGYRLWVWLKKPITKDHKPFVHTDVIPGRKFYDLPCHVDNVIGVTIKPI